MIKNDITARSYCGSYGHLAHPWLKVPSDKYLLIIFFFFSQWRKPEGKPIPLIWFTVFLLGLFLNAFSIAINASELCMTTACIIFYVVNGFGVILDTVFLYFWWTKCLFYWRKWCALNQEWSIVIGPGHFAPQRTNQDEQRSSHRTTSFIQIPHIVWHKGTC